VSFLLLSISNMLLLAVYCIFCWFHEDPPALRLEIYGIIKQYETLKLKGPDVGTI